MKAQDMSDDDLYKAAHNMDKYGGGFASTIARAFFRADSVNRVRVINAFPELFERYAPDQGWEA